MKVNNKFNKMFIGVLALLFSFYGLGDNVFARTLLSEDEMARGIHTLPHQAVANHNFVAFHNNLTDDEIAGIYFDDEILVIMALTHPDDAHINSLERIEEILENDSRFYHDYIRIEEGRFSISEQAMVQDYLSQFMGDTLYSSGRSVISNNVDVGLAYYIYDDEELRNETIEFLTDEVSRLSHKEDFSDILSFSRSEGGTFAYGFGDLYHGEDLEMYEYEEIDEYSKIKSPGLRFLGKFLWGFLILATGLSLIS